MKDINKEKVTITVDPDPTVMRLVTKASMVYSQPFCQWIIDNMGKLHRQFLVETNAPQEVIDKCDKYEELYNKVSLELTK